MRFLQSKTGLVLAMTLLLLLAACSEQPQAISDQLSEPTETEDQQSPPSSAEEFILATHTVTKDILDQGRRWTVVSPEVEYPQVGYHELWLTNLDEQPKLIETFPASIYDSVDFELNSQNSVNLKYNSGAPEGGAETEYIYDEVGEELVRMTKYWPKDYVFSFELPLRSEQHVSYINDGKCTGIGDGSKVMSKISGVKIYSGRTQITTKEYYFDQPSFVECIPHHEGILQLPGIEVTDFTTEGIGFELADGRIGRLTYESAEESWSDRQPVIEIDGQVIEAVVKKTDN